jgi:hypothetical protein
MLIGCLTLAITRPQEDWNADHILLVAALVQGIVGRDAEICRRRDYFVAPQVLGDN